MNDIFEQSQMAGAVGQAAQSSAAAGYYLQEQEKGLAETQLEVETIITEAYHLLKQDFKYLKDGRTEWKTLVNQNERVLTEWGVQRIMQVINFYVNKNGLLSNYDEKQIDRLMLRILTELNDLMLLKYQMLFSVPSFEQCKALLKQRIEEKVNLKVFSQEILGLTPDADQIRKDLYSEMEYKVEKELEKIKQEQRKEKLREYGLIMAQLEKMFYDTLNRAFRGEERGSIRRHTNISEVIGNHPQIQKNDGGMFKWTKR